MPTGTFSSPIDLFLGLSSRNAPPELAPYLDEVYNSLRILQIAFNTYAGASQATTDRWSNTELIDTLIIGNMGRAYLKATEDIAYGAIINVYNSTGVKIRNANATDGTMPGLGYCSTLAGIPSGEYGEVILGPSLCQAIAGLTIGTRYFLDTTDGLITATAPTADGNIRQSLGIALGASLLYIIPSLEWGPRTYEQL